MRRGRRRRLFNKFGVKKVLVFISAFCCRAYNDRMKELIDVQFPSIFLN